MRRALFAALALAVACGNDPTTIELDENGFAVFLAVDLDAMTETASGLLWQDFVVGTGTEAVNGGVVSVDYSGWLKNGTLFDSSSNRGQPYTFTLGQGDVIEGWDEGILGMREGGSRRLIIPPDLAYGSTGSGGSIPPDATLVFDVTLVAAATPAG
jgi:FKBP-type peptidyl-prolyl cis-trans isomerase